MVSNFNQSLDRATSKGGRHHCFNNITTMRSMAERIAINMPIQGCAAELIKLAMVAIHAWLQKDAFRAKLIMQVHDELVFDAFLPELDALKKHIPLLMEKALTFDVPIAVTLKQGPNWMLALT